MASKGVHPVKASEYNDVKLTYDMSALDNLYKPGFDYLVFTVAGSNGHEDSLITDWKGEGRYVRNGNGRMVLVDPDFRLPGTPIRITRMLRNLFWYGEVDNAMMLRRPEGGASGCSLHFEEAYMKTYRLDLEYDLDGRPRVPSDWDDEPFC